MGTTLGAIALAKVNEDIAWVGKFNMSDTEFDILNMANGEVLTALSDGSINNTDTFGYVFLKKHIGTTGSYFTDSHTCTPVSGDYAYIENSRTIDKAVRGLRAFLLPQLASPISVNADGTLTADVISFYETLCARALEVMQRDGEISAFNVIIDPTQNVLTNSEIEITVEIVPKGVARTITVNIGYTLAIQS